jgi:MFS family permease
MFRRSSPDRAGWRARYCRVLERPHARFLLVATFVGQLPNGFIPLALVLLLREGGAGFGGAGSAVAAYAIGSAGASPIRGRLVDRFGQNRVLCLLGAVNCASIVGVSFSHGGQARAFLLAFATGATLPPIGACMRRLWVRIVAARDDLDTAYALQALQQELLYVVGPASAGLAIALASPAVALRVAALATLAGPLAFVSARMDAPAARRARGDPLGALRVAGLRLLVAGHVAVGTVLGALEVAMPAFARGHGFAPASGWLMALFSGGSIVGGLVFGARRWSAPPGRRYATLSAVLAAGMLVLPLAASLPVMALIVAVAGIPLAPLFATVYALVTDLVPEALAVEAYGWLTGAAGGGAALGALLAGRLAGSLGPTAALALPAVAACALCAVATLARAALSVPPLRVGIGRVVLREPEGVGDSTD